jgi:hypothetical protein
MSPAKPATDPDSGIFTASMGVALQHLHHFQLEAADVILRRQCPLGSLAGIPGKFDLGSLQTRKRTMQAAVFNPPPLREPIGMRR